MIPIANQLHGIVTRPPHTGDELENHQTMAKPHLTITRRMISIHGKTRAVIEVQAVIDPVESALLLGQFPSENLFKRTAYAGGFADGGLQPSPPLARMLQHFMKNDACPEVTVKTLLAGQKYEGSGLWDMLCFEFIAKRAFDGLCELAKGASSFDHPVVYFGFNDTPDANLRAFAADTAVERTLELAAGPAAVAIGGVEGMADAA